MDTWPKASTPFGVSNPSTWKWNFRSPTPWRARTREAVARSITYSDCAMLLSGREKIGYSQFSLQVRLQIVKDEKRPSLNHRRPAGAVKPPIVDLWILIIAGSLLMV